MLRTACVMRPACTLSRRIVGEGAPVHRTGVGPGGSDAAGRTASSRTSLSNRIGSKPNGPALIEQLMPNDMTSTTPSIQPMAPNPAKPTLRHPPYAHLRMDERHTCRLRGRNRQADQGLNLNFAIGELSAPFFRG
jgi:hypothetical protein